MKIQDIAITTKMAPRDENGLQGESEILVTLRYSGSPDEGAWLNEMLVQAKYPPTAFWEALDWGMVDDPKSGRSD